ncbi:polysaccharide deacetylase family protein [Rufibacter soli]
MNGFPIKQIYGGQGHILMFHSVVPQDNRLRISNNFLEVSPGHLEKVILFFIRHGFDVLSLDQMHHRLSSQNSNGKFVVFTFDDGYLDNLEYGYPVFKKYNVPFAIYITTNFPDKKATIWWYPLEDIIRDQDHIQFKFKSEEYTFPCETEQEKNKAFIQIRALIQQCNEQDTPLLLKAIFDPFQIDLKARTAAMVLSWDQIIQLSKDPLVTIGAHTVSHYRLGALTRQEAKREIQESIAIIENQIKKKVEHFSFPFGTRNDVGEREFSLAKECNLKTAATTRSANVFIGHSRNLHALPRINIDMAMNEQELKDLTTGFTHFVTNRGKRVVTS